MKRLFALRTLHGPGLICLGVTMALANIAGPTLSAPPTTDFVLYTQGPVYMTLGISDTFNIQINNRGEAAPLELFIIFTGTLDQTDNVAAPGFDCEVRPRDTGINSSIRCVTASVAQSTSLEDGMKIFFKARGSSLGEGKIAVVLNSNVNVVESDYGNNSSTFVVTVR